MTGRLYKQRATLLSMQIRENNSTRLSDIRKHARMYVGDKTMQRPIERRSTASFKNDINPTWALDGGFPDLQRTVRGTVTFDYK